MKNKYGGELEGRRNAPTHACLVQRMRGTSGHIVNARWLDGPSRYLSFDQGVQSQHGPQVLGLHAVLSQDGGTDLQHVV